jgi:hypothetical protein
VPAKNEQQKKSRRLDLDQTLCAGTKIGVLRRHETAGTIGPLLEVLIPNPLSPTLWTTCGKPVDKPCWPGNRCRDWRHCEQCARIRQARIATAAERLGGIAGPLDWTTLQPTSTSFAAIANAREEFLRKTAPPGAIWTIEQAPTTRNLHINILTPSIEPPDLKHAHAFHVRAITDPRRVAAYISKREQMPAKEDYSGRLYGTAGPLWQWLSGRGQQPLIQGAAIQHDINADAGKLAPMGPARLTDTITNLTKDDYRRIAERRLPDLMAATLRKASALIGR